MNWQRGLKLNNNQKSRRYYFERNKKHVENPLEKAIQQPKRKFNHAEQIPKNLVGINRDLKNGVPMSEVFVPSSMSYGYYQQT